MYIYEKIYDYVYVVRGKIFGEGVGGRDTKKSIPFYLSEK
jgi:hypothetical protein